MNTVILNGGPLGGLIVEDWEMGTTRQFTDTDGNSYFYRNDEGDCAIFAGTSKSQAETSCEVFEDTPVEL